MIRARLVVVLLFAVGAGASQKPCPQPIWTVDLSAKYGLHTFGPVKHARNQLPPVWKTQQGVVFVSPETLAVYQVVQGNQIIPRAARDESGGGGRYILQVVFLDARQGQEVQTFRLITGSSDYSRIHPTHDGGFLVRVGQIMRLYSPTFQEIASKPLSLSPGTRYESWDVSVSPSGRLVIAKHVASYYDKPSANERYLFDADTLEPILNPQASEISDGSRHAPRYVPKVLSCPRGFGWITEQLFAGYGCKELKLFSLDGHLFWDVPMREQVVTVLGSRSLLAAEIHHHRADPFDLGLASQPLRTTLYDLATKSEKCSIRITEPVSGWWSSRFYALSPAGTVAIIQGNVLSLYRP